MNSIEPSSSVPLYYQLFNRLRRDVLSGLYSIGGKLPSQVALAAAFVFAQLLACATQTEDGLHFVHGSGGVAIAYESSGSGDVALIFVHGWSCDRSYWREQVSTFSANYRVIAIDLGGHGDSSNNRIDWSIQSFAQDVAAVAAAIDAEEVVLIGHSMGGPVVLEAAAQIDERIVGVIGIDTLKNIAVEPMGQLEAEEVFNTPLEEFSKSTEAFVRRAFFVEASPAALIDEIALDMAKGDPEVAAASGISLMTYDARDALNALRDKPFLLINAAYNPTDEAALKAAHPDSAVSVIANAGHFLMLERPREFNAALSSELVRILRGE